MDLLPPVVLLGSVCAAVYAHIDQHAWHTARQLLVHLDYDHNAAALKNTILASCLLCCGWFLARVWRLQKSGWLASLAVNMLLYCALMAYRGVAFAGMVNADLVNYIYAAGMLLLLLLITVQATSRPQQACKAGARSAGGKAADRGPFRAQSILEAATAYSLLGLFTTAYTVLSIQDVQSGVWPDWQRSVGAAACWVAIAAWLLTQLVDCMGGSKRSSTKQKTA